MYVLLVYIWKANFNAEYLYIFRINILFNNFLNSIPLNFQKPTFTFKFQYWQIQNKNIQGLTVNKKKVACSCLQLLLQLTDTKTKALNFSFGILCGLIIWDSVIDSKLFLFYLSLFFFQANLLVT